MTRTASSIASILLLLGASFVSAQSVSTDGIEAQPEVAAPVIYTFTEVNFSNDTFTQLLGINKQGVIAGYHGSGLDAAHPNKGFTLTLPNTFASENYPNSAQTQVIGINNAGSTSGFYVDTAGRTHGFVDVGNHFIPIDFPGTTFNQMLGYNNLDQASGYWQDSAGNFHPYLWNKSTPLISILIPGAVSVQATGTNDIGATVGFYIDGAGVNHGFMYYTGKLFRFTYPAATFTQALGVNNANQVVGDYTDANANTHGFVWTLGKFQSVDDPNGIGTTIVNGINDSGTLVGFWGNTAAGISHGFVATHQ